MRDDEQMIAFALEIDPQLLPFAPALLADLDELGTDAELIVEILESLALPKSTRVIDLGCGKGAVAIEIAQELGFQVLGVDLFAPFIHHCRTQAEQTKVSELCRFVCGDILKLTTEFEAHDVAIFGALGAVLGPLDKTIEVIRSYVLPGGYLIISDGYLKDNCNDSFAGFEDYARHEETLRRLTSSGDVLIKEFLEPTEEPDEEDEESALILTRAKALSKQHPELADAFHAFAESQKREVEFMRKNFVSAVWLLQRS